MRRLPVSLLLAAALNLVSAGPSAAEAPDPLQLVKQAAAVYAKDVRGIIGYRSVTESRINAPMFNRTILSTSYVVQRDGNPLRIVMERLVTDGKEASRDELLQQEAKTNESFKAGKGYFKPPYDARYTAAYRFRLEACHDCAPGMTAIGFESAVQDDQHGHGRMILDSAGRVREVRYTPNVFPPNVTHAMVTLTRDADGLRSLKADYQGSMGLIKGSFAMAQRNEGFRRYTSLEEAFAQAAR